MDSTKMIETIKKLLRTSMDSGATENEARLASLKAQKLMAKYNIEITDVEEQEEDISYTVIDTGAGNKWKYSLAIIISRNFCCKFFTIGTGKMAFYGYNHNTAVAKEVFNFLYNVGNRLAMRHYQNLRYRNEETKGVKNSFLIGYVKGIASVLDQQCRSLMLVTPKKVEETYKEMTSNNEFKTKNTRTAYNEGKSYEEGYKKGRETAESRYIE